MGDGPRDPEAIKTTATAELVHDAEVASIPVKIEESGLAVVGGVHQDKAEQYVRDHAAEAGISEKDALTALNNEFTSLDRGEKSATDHYMKATGDAVALEKSGSVVDSLQEALGEAMQFAKEIFGAGATASEQDVKEAPSVASPVHAPVVESSVATGAER